jgi:hypothetical protein
MGAVTAVETRLYAEVCQPEGIEPRSWLMQNGATHTTDEDDEIGGRGFRWLVSNWLISFSSFELSCSSLATCRDGVSILCATSII